MQESHSAASLTGQRDIIPPRPRSNQTNLHLRRPRFIARFLQNQPRHLSACLFFRFAWSALSSSSPTLGQCSFPPGPTAPSPPRVSGNFLPREMSKQKEGKVYKKIAFRSFHSPQKINTVVLSHYLASEHSFLLSRFSQPLVQLLLLQALAIPPSKSSFCSVSLAILPSGSARRESFTFIRRVLHHPS